MASMGRKNVHGKGGVRFKAGFTASKRKNMMRNLVTDLFKNGKVATTEATARDIKSVADRMVTYAKKGDLSSRRLVASYVRDAWADEAKKQTVIQKLFTEIAPKYATRNGGYTRSYKLVNRLGDNSPMTLIELV